ncbi:MAG: hypothetical protein KC466_20390 [Myxococcales bacterium]|nr:hypothetical protein [Myxococcales bacterium]
MATGAGSRDEAIAWYHWPLLLRPDRILTHLEMLKDQGRIDEVPSLWQVYMGILYMVHRIVRRPETVGVHPTAKVRGTLRAKILEYRPLRSPILIALRIVTPWDATGLLSDPKTIARHVVGTYHPGGNAIYDLECISIHPGELERTRARVLAAIEGRTWRDRWLQDLCVYEDYHRDLLKCVDRALAGDFGPPSDDIENPDTTVSTFARWCLKQPATPRAAWRAWRSGDLSFAPVA